MEIRSETQTPIESAPWPAISAAAMSLLCLMRVLTNFGPTRPDLIHNLFCSRSIVQASLSLPLPAAHDHNIEALCRQCHGDNGRRSRHHRRPQYKRNCSCFQMMTLRHSTARNQPPTPTTLPPKLPSRPSLDRVRTQQQPRLCLSMTWSGSVLHCNLLYFINFINFV